MRGEIFDLWAAADAGIVTPMEEPQPGDIVRGVYWLCYVVFWVVWAMWTFGIGGAVIAAMVSDPGITLFIHVFSVLILAFGGRALMVRFFGPTMTREDGSLPGWR